MKSKTCYVGIISLSLMCNVALNGDESIPVASSSSTEGFHCGEGNPFDAIFDNVGEPTAVYGDISGHIARRPSMTTQWYETCSIGMQRWLVYLWCRYCGMKQWVEERQSM